MSISSPWLSLEVDEEVVWSGRPRIQVLMWLAVPALVVPAVILLVRPTIGGALLGAVAWLAVCGAGYVYLTNVEYVVSTRYAYAKRGVLGRSVTQIGLHNIQDTTLAQGALGTRLDYGTVRFSTAGGEGATLTYHLIDEPAAPKRAVDRQMASVRGAIDARRDDPGDAVEELLAEAAAMRDAARRIDRTLERRGEQP